MPTYTIEYLPALNVGNLTFNQIDAELVSLKTKIDHPERTTNDTSYGQKLCGSVIFHTDNGKTTPHIQVYVSPYDYILNDTTGSNSLKNFMDSNGSGVGCVYSNKPSYKQPELTFKRFFDVEAIDLGWGD